MTAEPTAPDTRGAGYRAADAPPDAYTGPVPAGATVHEVPTWRLAWLARRFATLARRAARVGTEAPTWREVGRGWRRFGPLPGHGPDTRPLYEVALVVAEGAAPRFEGWALAAVVDLGGPGVPNVVHEVPGAGEAPGELWERGAACDHCGKDRARKRLAHLVHEDGRATVVGLSCLADFLGGPSAADVADLADAYAWASGDHGEPGPGSVVGVPLVDFLAAVAHAVRLRGWCSAGQGFEQGREPTAAHAWRLLFTERRYLGPEEQERAPEDHATAERIAAYLAAMPAPSSGFERNLAAVAAAGVVTERTKGYAAAAYVAEARAAERRLRAEAQEALGPGAWLDPPAKGRLVVTATVAAVRTFETAYGVNAWVTAVTEAGDEVQWKASGTWPEVGQHVTGRATVTAYRARVRPDAGAQGPDAIEVAGEALRVSHYRGEARVAVRVHTEGRTVEAEAPLPEGEPVPQVAGRWTGRDTGDHVGPWACRIVRRVTQVSRWAWAVVPTEADEEEAGTLGALVGRPVEVAKRPKAGEPRYSVAFEAGPEAAEELRGAVEALRAAGRAHRVSQYEPEGPAVLAVWPGHAEGHDPAAPIEAVALMQAIGRPVRAVYGAEGWGDWSANAYGAADAEELAELGEAAGFAAAVVTAGPGRAVPVARPSRPGAWGAPELPEAAHRAVRFRRASPDGY